MIALEGSMELVVNDEHTYEEPLLVYVNLPKKFLRRKGSKSYYPHFPSAIVVGCWPHRLWLGIRGQGC